jgi:hypothetical protein
MGYLLIAMLIYLQHKILETGISNEGFELSCSSNPSGRFDIREYTLDDNSIQSPLSVPSNLIKPRITDI